ncbi:ribonuclease domain-containing protein [Skermania piniformis]|uniref:Ribonuclease n=1 Tax=Skermania pinensis TaxID=39122 RepID=A0ABX8S6C1_9ACTN|nr:ribonuclease domain-containing protein [Skermania piniformis]QXQ13372.1 ribonuclease [Skermania piniformis]
MTHSPRSATAVLVAALLALLTVLTGCGPTAPETSVPPGRASSQVPDAVPAQAGSTLREIDAGRWPADAAPGTKGGDGWANREGRLPRIGAAGTPIRYREWDVNPKRPGRSRDAERIVTGSDGSAWYTGDHYETFVRMR